MLDENSVVFEILQHSPDANIINLLLILYGGGEKKAVNDLGQRIGKNPAAMRAMMSRPIEKWRVGEINLVCKALNCAPSLMYESLAERFRK